jgi:hypothetical protein
VSPACHTGPAYRCPGHDDDAEPCAARGEPAHHIAEVVGAQVYPADPDQGNQHGRTTDEKRAFPRPLEASTAK